MNKEFYVLNDIIVGKVVSLKPYGAFLKFPNEQIGLLHISEMSERFVHNIENFAPLNSEISVKVIEVNEETNFLRVSIKQLPPKLRKEQFSETNREDIDESTLDFTALEKALPHWINEGLILAKKEQNND